MSNDTSSSQSDNSPSSFHGSSPAKNGGLAVRTLSAAIVGGMGAILSWKAILLIGDVFVLPPDLAGLGFGSAPSPENSARLQAATLSLKLWNAAIWIATAGAILGAILGLTICLVRRLGYSGIRMILSTTFVGAVFGAVAGIAAIWIDTIARRNLVPGASDPVEYIALLMHSTTWLIVGLGIGFGIALGAGKSGRPRIESTVMIGLAAMVGGCLFPIVAGLVFPAVNTSWPIPPLDPNAGRILWLTLPSVLMGLAIGRNG